MTLQKLFDREKCTDEERDACRKYLMVIRLMENIDELKRLLFILSKSIMK
jgi:hypothetical protein